MTSASDLVGKPMRTASTPPATGTDTVTVASRMPMPLALRVGKFEERQFISPRDGAMYCEKIWVETDRVIINGTADPGGPGRA